ncbi:MAG TPA: hypothetical protein VIJ47_01400 [Acidimicrobiales bacterium]
MERWTFLMIAGPDGATAQIRVFLRAGDDPAAWPAAQLGLDGTEVAVDDVAHDYEAPEWKATQELDAGMGGGGAARLEQVKAGLRSRVGA